MKDKKTRTENVTQGFEVTFDESGEKPSFPSMLTNQLRLDIGCGPCKKSKFLGLDLIRTKATDVVADSANLPIKEGCFDYVYSRRCIQHVKNDEQAFKEIYRMLKLHGRFELIVASIYGYIFYKFGLV